MRPKKPRFCKVLVVIGFGVGAAGAETDDVASGVEDGIISCA